MGLVATFVTPAWADLPAAASVTIPRVERAPTVDQFVAAFTDSSFSSPLARIHDLRQRSPVDGAPVSERTDVYLGYDDRAVYFVFVCFDREVKRIRSRLVGRDKIPDDDDNVAVNIDTFHDRQHAYGFEVNAAGVQLDGLYSESAGWDFSYDMVWSSDARVTPQGYVALLAIPFSALRFTPNNPNGWGLLLFRGIPRKDEDAFWPQVSRSIAGRLVQAGDVRGLEGVSPGGNMQFAPYGSYVNSRSLDLRDPALPHFASERQATGGLDSKFVIHNSVVVDATFHPDFSQVESDQPQETVNRRFEAFFPELRPFFLENASYFSTPLVLVFTRRIADPQAGGRVTGKLGRFSLGALVSDDRSPGEIGPPSSPLHADRALFSVVRLSRDIGRSDNLGMIFTDRTDRMVSNHVGGFDGRFTFARSWVASGQTVTSVTDDRGSRSVGQATELAISRAGRKLNGSLQYDDFGSHFRSDVGFINRLDLQAATHALSYRFRPEGPLLIDWGPDLFAQVLWDHRGLRVGTTYTPKLTFDMALGTSLSLFHNFAGEVLRPGDAAALSANRSYDEDQSGLTFATSAMARCIVSGTFSTGRGVDFAPPAGVAPEPANVLNGNLALSLRVTNALTLDGSYILTRVSDPNVSATHFDEHIARVQGNYQFTRAASLRTIAQYHGLMPNATFTSADLTKRLTADFLFTYLIHPYTAVYVGYTDDRQNIDPALSPTANGVARTRNGLLNDGRQLFMKVSYLIRP